MLADRMLASTPNILLSFKTIELICYKGRTQTGKRANESLNEWDQCNGLDKILPSSFFIFTLSYFSIGFENQKDDYVILYECLHQGAIKDSCSQSLREFI